MQKLQLSIPEPCHENWQAMTPTEQGRFCKACAKEVVDFSMMSDTEVLNYFNCHINEKVCGRALPTQLGRTIHYPKEPKKNRFWYWNYIAMFFVFFSKATNSEGQKKASAKTEIVPVPVKPENISRNLSCKVGEVAITSWTVKGKVVDNTNKPVPFASVLMLGTRSGTATDQEGNFTFKVKPGDVLAASAIGLKSAEIVITDQQTVSFKLEAVEQELGGLIIVKESRRVNKYPVLLNVKDDKSGAKISNARIIVAETKAAGHDTALADKNGSYALTDIKKNEEYFIRVEATGYESNEFSITAKEARGKKEWEVLLTPKADMKKSEQQTVVRLGGVRAISADEKPVYIVDGSVDPDADMLNPDDIDDIIVLKPAEAGAIYGQVGKNGAVVITTRKTKIKDMKEVVIVSDHSPRAVKGAMGSVFYAQKYSFLEEMKASLNSLLTDSVKIYPNPVPRGYLFSVYLKLKEPGPVGMQVSDPSGRIVIQREINITGKEQVEKIQTNSNWGPGAYYLRVFNAKNQIVSKSSFIVR